jgi:hypothetical protein
MRRSWTGLVAALLGAFLVIPACGPEKRNFSGLGGGEGGQDETTSGSASGGSSAGTLASGGALVSGGRAGSSAGGASGGEGAVSGSGPSAGNGAGDGGSGTEVDLKANGITCSSNQECESAVCRDKVCCDTPCEGTCEACAEVHTGAPNGTCAPVLAGSDPHEACQATAAESCGTDGSCDGAGSCRKFGPNQVCASAACSGANYTPNRTCDGKGVCQTATAMACGAYPCSEVGCQQPCTMDTECPSGSYCDETKKCHNKSTDGQACTAGNQCRSNFCVDGVCCENECKGTCSACSNAKTGQNSGRCVGVPSGQDPDNECAVDAANACGRDGACTGGGACRVRSVGTACGTATCSGSTLTPQGACDGASSCTASAATACPGNLTCASTSACRTTCSTDANCLTGYFCAAGSCSPKKGKGASCGAANECTGGFCKDNFCCDGACSLTCQGCSNALTGLANGTCGQKTSDATKACPLNAPTMCAAVQTDLNNCGTCGTSCASVANQTKQCKSGKCDYQCTAAKYNLTCSPSSTKTTCSNWDFEVASDPDSWFIVTDSNASTGPLTSSNKFASSGTRSLAIPYSNALGGDRWITIAVKLCANGGTVDLTGKQVTWKFRMDPPASSVSGYNYFVRWDNNNLTGGLGNHDFNSITTATWWSSTEYYANDPFFTGSTAAAIGFHLQATEPWTGTFYLDDIQIY